MHVLKRSIRGCILVYRVFPLSLSAEVEELGNKELELGDKTIIIEIKANEQGKFVKILEVYIMTACT